MTSSISPSESSSNRLVRRSKRAKTVTTGESNMATMVEDEEKEDDEEDNASFVPSVTTATDAEASTSASTIITVGKAVKQKYNFRPLYIYTGPASYTSNLPIDLDIDDELVVADTSRLRDNLQAVLSRGDVSAAGVYINFTREQQYDITNFIFTPVLSRPGNTALLALLGCAIKVFDNGFNTGFASRAYRASPEESPGWVSQVFANLTLTDTINLYKTYKEYADFITTVADFRATYA